MAATLTDHRGKVLILGSDTRSFLSVIRSLGRVGLEVHAAWSARDSVALKSKYLAHYHQLTRPPTSGWQEELRELLDREHFQLIIPCNDPSILPLHQERNTFEQFPIYLIQDSIFEAAMDKAAVNQIASSAGIRLPNEVLIESSEEAGQLDRLKAPFVLKPTRSYSVDRLSKKNHVMVIHDRDAANRVVQEMLEHTSVAAQEYFEGSGVGVEFLAKDGEVLFAFQHERLHEPPGGGGSSLRRSCKVDTQLREETERLVNALRYTGVGMAEFRYNKTNHDWIFVELNSRFWGSLPLAIACGADFPTYLYEMWCENRTRFPADYRVNRACRNWLLDFQWLRKTIAATGRSPVSLARLLARWIFDFRYFLTLREYSDTLTWDDPGPGIQEVRDALSAIPVRIRRQATGIGFVRKRMRRQGLEKLRTARSLLFICKGNICRSPFAAHYAAARLNGLESVSSCGYFPKVDRPSPDNAVLAATRFNINLSAHRSRVVNAELVDAADAIIVFDQENLTEMTARFPGARSKVVMLGTIEVDGNPEIADPYGASVEQFEATYNRISQALNQITG